MAVAPWVHLGFCNTYTERSDKILTENIIFTVLLMVMADVLFFTLIAIGCILIALFRSIRLFLIDKSHFWKSFFQILKHII